MDYHARMHDLKTDQLLKANAADLARLMSELSALEKPLESAARLVARCLLSGGKLLCCGNGGSAADSAHLATEFVCRYSDDRKPFPAIAFPDTGSTMTAIVNDYHFDQVFARQIHAFARPGDVLVVFTTSGKSPNIVQALKAAAETKIDSIAFLGKTGGACKGKATVELHVTGTDVTARIQEVHKLLLHTLCESVDVELKKA
jgi:D-sedoheptulose 7-phosphate isomerase